MTLHSKYFQTEAGSDASKSTCFNKQLHRSKGKASNLSMSTALVVERANVSESLFCHLKCNRPLDSATKFGISDLQMRQSGSGSEVSISDSSHSETESLGCSESSIESEDSLGSSSGEGNSSDNSSHGSDIDYGYEDALLATFTCRDNTSFLKSCHVQRPSSTDCVPMQPRRLSEVGFKTTSVPLKSVSTLEVCVDTERGCKGIVPRNPRPRNSDSAPLYRSVSFQESDRSGRETRSPQRSVIQRVIRRRQSIDCVPTCRSVTGQQSNDPDSNALLKLSNGILKLGSSEAMEDEHVKNMRETTSTYRSLTRRPSIMSSTRSPHMRDDSEDSVDYGYEDVMVSRDDASRSSSNRRQSAGHGPKRGNLPRRQSINVDNGDLLAISKIISEHGPLDHVSIREKGVSAIHRNTPRRPSIISSPVKPSPDTAYGSIRTIDQEAVGNNLTYTQDTTTGHPRRQARRQSMGFAETRRRVPLRQSRYHNSDSRRYGEGRQVSEVRGFVNSKFQRRASTGGVQYHLDEISWHLTQISIHSEAMSQLHSHIANQIGSEFSLHRQSSSRVSNRPSPTGIRQRVQFESIPDWEMDVTAPPRFSGRKSPRC